MAKPLPHPFDKQKVVAEKKGLHGITIHQIPPDEFAVEGYLDVHGDH